MSEIDAHLKDPPPLPPSAAGGRDAIARDPAVYKRAAADPEAFWAGFARELEWMQPWSRVLEWNAPHAKWFVGGDRRTLTYWDLYKQVGRFANVLKSLGVKRGDRVALYLPLIPELAVAMLACARIGAIHSVIFGGFSP